MTVNPAPLTAKSTIAQWLAHPVGAPAVRTLLSSMGQGDDVLEKIRSLPLATLATMSRGRLSNETVQSIVLQANGGTIPEEDAAAPAGARFSSATIIVTGAGSGIGKATAERIVSEGGRVIAVDVDAERIETLADASPDGSVVTVAGDVTDDADVARIVAAAGERIDGLANIAGIMDGMLPLHEVGNEVWDRVIAVNVTGTFKLTRAALPAMLAAATGAVVNVASEASLRGNAAGTAYTASKHAVVGLTRSAAFLYGPSGIRVNAVAPGPTATGISGDFSSEFSHRRLGPFLALVPPVTAPETLASSIAWLLSDDSANVNGQVLASDGGWSVQ